MAKTNKARAVYIAGTGSTASVQASDLTLAAFNALTWIKISNVGSIGESGPSTNLPTFDELETDVIQKGKGITDAGTTPMEMSTNMTDPGQIALRAAALTTSDYAISWVDDDGVTHYQRGKISGPTAPNGRNEDFRRQSFAMGWNQREAIGTAADFVAPVNSLVPSIHGTAPSTAANTVLTAGDGLWAGHPASFVYQWEKDVAGNGAFSLIAGQTAKVFSGTAAVGNTNRIRVGVKGVNAAGTTAAFAYSMPTVPVVA